MQDDGVLMDGLLVSAKENISQVPLAFLMCMLLNCVFCRTFQTYVVDHHALGRFFSSATPISRVHLTFLTCDECVGTDV